MARSILANPSSNLNLSRQEIALFQQIIMAGNKMSKALNPDCPLPLPEVRAKLWRRWSNLMVTLAKRLL